jgi:hypothetical protein
MNNHLHTKPDEHLEARITAYILGEASAFEAAEIESLITQSPELKLFANRLRNLDSLLKEAETTSNISDPKWKLSAEHRASLNPILGHASSLPQKADPRIRRAWFRAAISMAAMLLITLLITDILRPQKDVAYHAISHAPSEMKSEQHAFDKSMPEDFKLNALETPQNSSAEITQLPEMTGAAVAQESGISAKLAEADILTAEMNSVRGADFSLGGASGGEGRSIAPSAPAHLQEAAVSDIVMHDASNQIADGMASQRMLKAKGVESKDLSARANVASRQTQSPPDPSTIPMAANEKKRDEAQRLLEGDRVPQLEELPAISSLFKKSKDELVAASMEIPTSQQPISSFPLNISDTSFQLALAAIQKGNQPDPSSIRIEEFYNAVAYNDPAPAAGERIAAAINQALHPIIPGRNLFRVSIRTSENVDIQIKFNPERVREYKLIGYDQEPLPTPDIHIERLEPTEPSTEQSGTAVYQIEPISNGSGDIGELVVRIQDTTTGKITERKWPITYEVETPALDRATPPMQLATLSMLAAQKLQGGALADAIHFNDLTPIIEAVKQANPQAGPMITLINSLK